MTSQRDWDADIAEASSEIERRRAAFQRAQEELLAARTARTAYHVNPTTGWRVRGDGTVVYRTQEWA